MEMNFVGGFVFGSMLIVAVFVALAGVSWVLAEIVAWAVPGLASFVRSQCGWELYQPGAGRPNRTPRHEDAAVHTYLRSLPVQEPVVMVPVIASTMTVDTENSGAVATSFMRWFRDNQRRARRRPSEFQALRQPRICPGCKHPRIVFHVATRLCSRCVFQAAAELPRRAAR